MVQMQSCTQLLARMCTAINMQTSIRRWVTNASTHQPAHPCVSLMQGVATISGRASEEGRHALQRGRMAAAQLPQHLVNKSVTSCRW